MRVKSKLNNKDTKLSKLFVIPYLILFLLIGIAYSGFTTSLATEATATIQKYIRDYVYISNITVSEASGGVSNSAQFLPEEIYSSVECEACGSYLVYDVELTNTSSYKAYITGADIISKVNENGSNTTGFDIEILNVTVNETYIEPHSTKIMKVKVKNNCTTSDKKVNFKLDITTSLYKYFDLTINATPSDATVTISTAEGVYTGTGSLTHRVYEGDVAVYTVSRAEYKEYGNSYTMGQSNHTENITLQAEKYYQLKVTPNVADQNCQCVVGGTQSLFYTTDYSKAQARVKEGTEIECNVGINGESEYYYDYDSSTDTYYGYYTKFTINQDTTLTPSFTERAYISGTYKNTNSKTAANGTLKNYHPGYYFIEIWGGTGGNGYNYSKGYGGYGGANGYVYGYVYLNWGDQITYSLGGSGEKGDSNGRGTSGGANGGGLANFNDRNVNYLGGSGGGYSSLKRNDSYLMVAAGGGGAGGPAGALGQKKGGDGGAGATVSSSSTSVSGGVVFYGNDGSRDNRGTGGKTTGGYNMAHSDSHNYDGSSLQGGQSYNRGGGGGAGWFGGGGGDSTSSDSHVPTGGGGGGSSFLSTSVIYLNLPSVASSKITGVGSNPSSTGGAVTITYLGKTI